MSTPPYFPPSVGPSGLQVPSYQAIFADNLQAFLNIYGQNQYVAPDSAIYQLLSMLSLKQADINLALQLVYNQSSPQTAVGAGLDRQVKMNGLARAPFSFSTALLAVVGVSGTSIVNGFAQDQTGNVWALPATVVIPVGGSINVTATCTAPGAIAAAPGTINIINSPVSGWQSVTNVSAAVLGEPVESDSSLRARQSISVALPSLTPISATIAAILATPGVVRVAPGYPTPGGPGTSIENPTGAVDSWGNPPHSISLVVQCSDVTAVALAIFSKKTPGCLTHGTTTVAVVDPNTGVTNDISFYLPSNLTVVVQVVLKGYGSTPTSTNLQDVKDAIVAYLDELAIGETVSISALYYEAMAVNVNIAQPSFGVQSMKLGVQAASTEATFSSGANVINVASASGIANGQIVQGDGIVVGTVVTGVSGTTISLSNITTAASGGEQVEFYTLGASDVPMPNFYYSAYGDPDNVSVSVA